jgi:sialate O-acetylesterase
MKMTFLLFLLATACCLSSLHALELSGLYADNMVLQAGRSLKIQGKSAPDETVQIEIDGKVFSGKAAANGCWMIELPPQAPGGPHVFKIAAASGSKIFHNVLFGEVWLASGQSNMNMALQHTDQADAEIRTAEDPDLRIFRVGLKTSATPVSDVHGRWVAATPETAKGVSAVAWYFAKELRQELKVPVGIITASHGGTAAESWMSAEALHSLPETAGSYAGLQKSIQALEQAPTNVDLDDSNWMEEGIPLENWNRQKRRIHWDYELHPVEYDGVIWARKEIELPADWAGQDLILSLGKIDDYETTFFNGTEIGKTTQHTLAVRVYEIPGALSKAGKNLLAVKTFKIGWGGLIGPDKVMFLQRKGSEDKVPVGGEWLFRAAKLEFKMISPRLPTSLYNGMIAPLRQYPIRGVIWYQGEANAQPENAKKYRNTFAALIEDWRRAFDQETMPFYYVQLAGFKTNLGNGWPLLREAQRRTLEIPNTGMASAFDIGDPKDIHPGNKREVGRRLALWPLVNEYGHNKIPSGPLLREIQVENGKVRIFFNYGQGLKSNDGQPLRHFEIADKNRVFHPATAEISGESLLVYSSQVSKPAVIRYAWKDYLDNLNFSNETDLPASPFIADIPEKE